MTSALPNKISIAPLKVPHKLIVRRFWRKRDGKITGLISYISHVNHSSSSSSSVHHFSKSPMPQMFSRCRICYCTHYLLLKLVTYSAQHVFFSKEYLSMQISFNHTRTHARTHSLARTHTHRHTHNLAAQMFYHLTL